MSHVSKLEIQFRNIEQIKAACQEIAGAGLVFCADQKTYRWYGTESKCDHAISIADSKRGYELGLVRQDDGSFEVEFDDYDEAVRPAVNALKVGYAMAGIRAQAAARGFALTATDTAEGGKRIIAKPLTGQVAGMAGTECTIQFEISRTGEVEMEASGWTGPACMAATEPFAVAVGMRTNTTQKPEFGVTDQAFNTLRNPLAAQ